MILLAVSVSIRVHILADLEHKRSRRASTSLSSFYSILVLSTGVHLRSLLIRNTANVTGVVLLGIQLVLTIALLLLENGSTKPADTRPNPPQTWPLQPESPEARTSFFSKLFSHGCGNLSVLAARAQQANTS
ncbi:hypothetical protein BCR44DRAFT_1182992 [Catenaria anguillulae PL171]|uniref:Uncharacterized protein n=1 Tax=Catenaria anguillulae PL171 TaxID=765915 RepID=A0A1Y2HM01_9FUNG|nr:hypothetical protein BCR44DRAFT_1182992 [Catenaria anguillulae PL171]